MTRNEINLKNYITIKEAAAFLGVNPMTLRNWDKQGKLKSRRHPALPPFVIQSVSRIFRGFGCYFYPAIA